MMKTRLDLLNELADTLNQVSTPKVEENSPIQLDLINELTEARSKDKLKSVVDKTPIVSKEFSKTKKTKTPEQKFDDALLTYVSNCKGVSWFTSKNTKRKLAEGLKKQISVFGSNEFPSETEVMLIASMKEKESLLYKAKVLKDKLSLWWQQKRKF